MIKKTLLLTALLGMYGLGNKAGAQTNIIATDNSDATDEKPITISYKLNANRSIDFDYQKTDPGTYTVIVNFSNLTNTSNANMEEVTIRNNSGRLLRLTPNNPDEAINFSYKYAYIRGRLKPKYDANFVYLLPFKNSTPINVIEVDEMSAHYFGNTAPKDWKAYCFFTDNEETVTAARKGVVVEVKDIYQTNEDKNIAYKSTLNYIIIEHPDGTLGTYRGFKKGSIAVKVGQTVLPGTTLGVDSKYGPTDKYCISFRISYLKSTDYESTKYQTIKTAETSYGFITPKFITAENTVVTLEPQHKYIAVLNTELIKKELNKRELKELPNVAAN